MKYSNFFGIYQKQNNKVAICSESLSMFYEMFSRKTTRKLRVSPLGENVSNEKKNYQFPDFYFIHFAVAFYVVSEKSLPLFEKNIFF